MSSLHCPFCLTTIKLWDALFYLFCILRNFLLYDQVAFSSFSAIFFSWFFFFFPSPSSSLKLPPLSSMSLESLLKSRFRPYYRKKGQERGLIVTFSLYCCPNVKHNVLEVGMGTLRKQAICQKDSLHRPKRSNSLHPHEGLDYLMSYAAFIVHCMKFWSYCLTFISKGLVPGSLEAVYTVGDESTTVKL